MSATLANISDLTRFLDAQLYVNNFRPVKLIEYVKLGDHIYELTEDHDNSQSSLESHEEQMADRLIHRRMVNFQVSFLIFCGTGDVDAKSCDRFLSSLTNRAKQLIQPMTK